MSASLSAGAAGRGSSGLMVRRLLPAVLLMPLLLGWLCLQRLSAGYYGAGGGCLHVQGLVGSLIVELFAEVVAFPLLSARIGGRGAGVSLCS